MDLSDLYWVVSLAEEGTHARVDSWRGKGGALDMMGVVNAGEFFRTVERLADAISREAEKPLPPAKRKRK